MNHHFGQQCGCTTGTVGGPGAPAQSRTQLAHLKQLLRQPGRGTTRGPVVNGPAPALPPVAPIRGVVTPLPRGIAAPLIPVTRRRPGIAAPRQAVMGVPLSMLHFH